MVKRYSTIFYICLLLGNFTSLWSQSVVDTLSQFAQQNNIAEGEEFQRLFKSGQQYFLKESFTEAAGVFGRAALISPRHPSAHLYLSTTLFALEQYELGGAVMRRTIRLYPFWPSLKLNFSSFFPPAFEFIHKLSKFENWLFASPRPSDTYFLFGVLCQFSGLNKKAEGAYKLLLSKDPAYFEAQQFLEILTGQKVPRSIPEWTELLDKGQKQFQSGQFQDAVNTWGDACSYYPEKARSLYFLVHGLCAIEEYAHAHTCLRLALRLDADGLLGEEVLRHVDKNGDNLGAIMAGMEKRLQENVSNMEMLFLLAYFYLILQEQNKAGVALTYLQEGMPQDAQVQFLAKKLSENSGNNRPVPEKKVPEEKKTDERKNEPVKTNKNKELELPKNEDKKLPPSVNNPILNKAKEIFKNEKYDEAAQLFIQAIVDKPEDMDAKWLLGMSTFAIGQYNHTFKILKKMLEFPELRQNKLDWPAYYKSSALFEEHLKKLSVWVRDHADDTEALFVLGYVLFASRKDQQARGVFQRLIQRMPKDEDVIYFHQALQK